MSDLTNPPIGPHIGLVESNERTWKRWLLESDECKDLDLTAAQERAIAKALDAAGVECPLPRRAINRR